MDWGYPTYKEAFETGYQTAPTASIGQAIRGVLDLHNKMAIQRGQTRFETEQAKGLARFKETLPSTQALTRQRETTADLYAPEQGVTREELLAQPPEVTEVGGQRFYSKPLTTKGRRTGQYTWQPVSKFDFIEDMLRRQMGGMYPDMYGDVGAPQATAPRTNVREQYNELREQGLSREEALQKLGIRR